jgi:hypothetical protein
MGAIGMAATVKSAARGRNIWSTSVLAQEGPTGSTLSRGVKGFYQLPFFGAATLTSNASVQVMSTLSPTLTCDSAFLSCTFVL